MGKNTLWVHQEVTFGMSTVAVQRNQVLASIIGQDVLSRATIVAIKGTVTFQPLNTAATNIKPHAQVGIIVAEENLAIANFPILGTEEVSQGWMWRGDYLGTALGDGTKVVNSWGGRTDLIDVKSKRKLSGVGKQDLHVICDVVALGNLSSLRVDISILIHLG